MWYEMRLFGVARGEILEQDHGANAPEICRRRRGRGQALSMSGTRGEMFPLDKLMTALGDAVKCRADDKFPECYVSPDDGFVRFQCDCMGKYLESSELIEMR